MNKSYTKTHIHPCKINISLDFNSSVCICQEVPGYIWRAWTRLSRIIKLLECIVEGEGKIPSIDFVSLTEVTRGQWPYRSAGSRAMNYDQITLEGLLMPWMTFCVTFKKFKKSLFHKMIRPEAGFELLTYCTIV